VTPLRTLLDQAIRESGLSAAEVARRAGVTEELLCVVRRKRDPSAGTLGKVLSALGRDVALVPVQV
jgi:DNA-binding phage protein